MRILKRIWWLPLIIYLLVMPSFISEKVFMENCKAIDVRIVDSAEYNFISSGDIFSMVHNDSRMILGTPVDEIETGKIEKRIRDIRVLETVEVYKTADGILHIDADQRDPVVRIITSFGNSYYLDVQGEIIPHSSSYTPRVMVVSGNISIPDSSITKGNIRSLPDENIVKKILKVVNTINDREFWSGQVEQVWVGEGSNLDLIPRVGNHVLRIGSPESLDRKLDYLENLYSNALPDIGWNKYREINLMYEGQIVCKKR